MDKVGRTRGIGRKRLNLLTSLLHEHGLTWALETP